MSDQPQVNLNVTDISDAVKVIDHACEQGAFRGWTNIRQILALRDRLDMFSTAAAAITNPEADSSDDQNTITLPEQQQQQQDESPQDTAATADEPVAEETRPPVSHPRRQRGGRMTART